MWIGVASSGLSCNLSALAPRGLQRPGAEPCRCHLLRSSQRTRPGNQARSTCGYPAEGERLRSRPFPLGEVSWGQTGAGPYGEVLAGLRRRAEARRLYCFGDRAAAAATKTVGVGGRNRRCPREAAAGSAAARSAAKGRAGRRAEQLRHGEYGRRRRRCSSASSSPLRSGRRPGYRAQPAEGRRAWGSGRQGLGRGAEPPGLRAPRFPFWGASFLGTVLPRPLAGAEPGLRSKGPGAPN